MVKRRLCTKDFKLDAIRLVLYQGHTITEAAIVFLLKKLNKVRINLSAPVDIFGNRALPSDGGKY